MSLFKPAAKLTYKVGTGTAEFPDLLQQVTADTGLSDPKIEDILGITTLRKKEEVAKLARTNYANYVEYKSQIFDQITNAVRNEFRAAASRWKSLGYSDEDAIKAAEKAAKEHKKELMEWYNELFSHHGKVENVF